MFRKSAVPTADVTGGDAPGTMGQGQAEYEAPKALLGLRDLVLWP